MRPYLAIIKDSFREARASRVLWVLLLLVTFMLIGLAPFGYRKVVTGSIEPRDCLDWVAMLNEIEADGTAAATTPAGRIWSQLDPSGREAISKFPRERDKVTRRDMQTFGQIMGSLNRILDEEDLYEAEAWASARLNKESKELLEQRKTTTLDENQTRRLNRLLVEAAFPRIMKRSQSENMMFLYGPWDMPMGMAIPFTEERVERIVDETIVTLMSLLLSTVGVFVAILATAPQINHIFDEGSISLLLSKPITRSGLYLAKFVGSCAFIFIMAAYFITGLTLIAGLRFGVWEWRPLACLPLFIFMFMTYYCVSGLATIIWKNNIISIAAAIMFWLVCFSLGTVNGFIEVLHINSISITQLTVADDNLVASNRMGQLFLWDEEEANWNEVFQEKRAGQNNQIMNMVLRPKIIGPVFDTEDDRMLAIRSTGAFRNISAGSPMLYSGQRFENYASERGPVVPGGPLGLYKNAKGKFLVVAIDGIYQLRGKVDRSQAPIEMFGVEIPFTGTSRPFEKISPDEGFTAVTPAAADFDWNNGEVVLYSQGHVSTWRATAEGNYEAGPTRELVEEEDRSAAIAVGGDTIMVAFESGEVHLLDRATLDNKHDAFTPLSDPPRLALASPDGNHFAILYHTGYLNSIDPEKGTSRRARIGGQGDITAAVYTGGGDLAVVDRAVRVSQYDPATGSRQSQLAPPMGILDKVYYWCINPLYQLFPKPGELDGTARYVLTGEKTVAEEENADLSEQQLKLRPWAPIPSTALFIVVMLGVSCWMMERHEF